MRLCYPKRTSARHRTGCGLSRRRIKRKALMGIQVFVYKNVQVYPVGCPKDKNRDVFDRLSAGTTCACLFSPRVASFRGPVLSSNAAPDMYLNRRLAAAFSPVGSSSLSSEGVYCFDSLDLCVGGLQFCRRGWISMSIFLKRFVAFDPCGHRQDRVRLVCI